jgi:Zn-dependent protease with chaperone function
MLFGSVIALTATGLVAGTTIGVLLASRLEKTLPILQLIIVLVSTVSGFSIGVLSSLFVSPFVLRHAFFAKLIGEWNGTTVYSAADEDLPGRLPNIFVAGFSFGIGPFKPAVFIAEGAVRILSKETLEAVFAHELAHLDCRHLWKRLVVGVGTFLVASFLTSVALIGLHWSGYTEIGGFFSLIAGILPATLTWMTMRQMMWNQEFEADRHALDHYGIDPAYLLQALRTLQRSIGGEPHPLVAERMAECEKRIEKATPVNPSVEPSLAA